MISHVSDGEINALQETCLSYRNEKKMIPKNVLSRLQLLRDQRNQDIFNMALENMEKTKQDWEEINHRMNDNGKNLNALANHPVIKLSALPYNAVCVLVNSCKVIWVFIKTHSLGIIVLLGAVKLSLTNKAREYHNAIKHYNAIDHYQMIGTVIACTMIAGSSLALGLLTVQVLRKLQPN